MYDGPEDVIEEVADVAIEVAEAVAVVAVTERGLGMIVGSISNGGDEGEE